MAGRAPRTTLRHRVAPVPQPSTRTPGTCRRSKATFRTAKATGDPEEFTIVEGLQVRNALCGSRRRWTTWRQGSRGRQLSTTAGVRRSPRCRRNRAGPPPLGRRPQPDDGALQPARRWSSSNRNGGRVTHAFVLRTAAALLSGTFKSYQYRDPAASSDGHVLQNTRLDARPPLPGFQRRPPHPARGGLDVHAARCAGQRGHVTVGRIVPDNFNAYTCGIVYSARVAGCAAPTTAAGRPARRPRTSSSTCGRRDGLARRTGTTDRMTWHEDMAFAKTFTLDGTTLRVAYTGVDARARGGQRAVRRPVGGGARGTAAHPRRRRRRGDGDDGRRRGRAAHDRRGLRAHGRRAGPRPSRKAAAQGLATEFLTLHRVLTDAVQVRATAPDLSTRSSCAPDLRDECWNTRFHSRPAPQDRAMIPDIARLRPGVVTRSISPENPDGRGGRGRAGHRGHRRRAARDLGQGWKVSPSVEIAPRTRPPTSPTIDGPGRITHIWLTTHPDHWRTLLLRAHWDGADAPADRGAGRRLLRQGLGPSSPSSSSSMVAVNPHGGFNCYWPMPFRQGARLTLDEPVRRCTGRRLLPGRLRDRRRPVGVRATCTRSGGAATRWRTGRRTRSSTGCAGTGHYVGTYLAWGVNNHGWWGEGEIKFYLDGDDDSRRSAAPAPRTTSAAPGTSTCPARATRRSRRRTWACPGHPAGRPLRQPAALRHVPLARARPDPLRRGAAGRPSRRSGWRVGRPLPPAARRPRLDGAVLPRPPDRAPGPRPTTRTARRPGPLGDSCNTPTRSRDIAVGAVRARVDADQRPRAVAGPGHHQGRPAACRAGRGAAAARRRRPRGRGGGRPPRRRRAPRSRAASSFSRHGPESSTRSVRANGVVTGASAARNAIRSSIFHAPTARASSATSPARVTAGLGSSRYSPGSPTGTSSPGAGRSVCRSRRDEDRRPASSASARRVTTAPPP